MNGWKVVEKFPDYSINYLGEVKRNASGRVLAYKINQYGVVYVGLMRDGVQRQRSVALLVASAFIPCPFEPFDTPIHLNGNRWDNNADNLVWRPHWFAVKYNCQFKERYDNPIETPIADLATGRKFNNSFHCATTFGLLERDVVLSILNRTYVWPRYQQFGVVED